MEELIKALQIFLKYGNPTYPTSCGHDTLYICCIDPKDVCAGDLAKLSELGFEIDTNLEQFYSFKYGSA